MLTVHARDKSQRKGLHTGKLFQFFSSVCSFNAKYFPSKPCLRNNNLFLIPRQVHIALLEAMPLKINNLHPRNYGTGLSQQTPLESAQQVCPCHRGRLQTLCCAFICVLISPGTQHKMGLASTCACSLTSVLFAFSLPFPARVWTYSPFSSFAKLPFRDLLPSGLHFVWVCNHPVFM